MKLKQTSTMEACSPLDWIGESWNLTYTRKDDMVDVFQVLAKLVADFKQQHSNVKTEIDIESYGKELDIMLCRKMTDAEKVAFKQEAKIRKEQALEKRKREVKAEAKQLGLL